MTGERPQNAVSPYKGLVLSLKREVLTHATTWMNRESVQSEVTQTQKDKDHVIPPIGGTQTVQVVATERRMAVTRCSEQGKRGVFV